MTAASKAPGAQAEHRRSNSLYTEQLWESVALNVVCAAPDDNLLLVDWLGALIYEMAVQHWVLAALTCRSQVNVRRAGRGANRSTPRATGRSPNPKAQP